MIGIIDSGSGGYNVINACNKFFKEDYVYIFDDLNCPYGNKDKEALKKITKKNIEYLINNYNLDLIIFACNTISSITNTYDFNYKIPIIKTNPNLNYAIKDDVKTCKNNVLLFATKNTIFNNKIVKFNMWNNSNIKTAYIKNLPKIIDNYLLNKNSNNKRIIIKALKKKFCYKNKLKKQYKNIKYIILGCTHFKYIQPFLSNIFNGNISFIYCEKTVALNAKYLIRKSKKKTTIKIIKTSEIF